MMATLGNVGLGLLLFWAAKSVFVYWTMDCAGQYEDFASVMVKPWGFKNEAGIEDILMKKAFFPEAMWYRKAHTLTSLFSAIMLIIQLTPAVRRKYLNVHRATGRAFLISAALQYPLFVLLFVKMRLAVSIAVVEAPVLVLLPLFAVQGYTAIKAGDIAQHRAHMIMLSCCFFFFGAARLCAVTLLAMHNALGWIVGTSTDVLADVSATGFPDMVYGPAVALSAWLCFGAGTYNAWFSKKARALQKAGEAARVAKEN